MSGNTGTTVADLPASGSLSGSELVYVIQNNSDRQTTTGSIAGLASLGVVVNAPPFLISGTVENGGTITSAPLAAQSLIGHGGTTSGTPSALSLSADFTITAGGTLGLGSIATAGTYNLLGVSATGRITSGSSIAYLTGNQTITLSGDVTGSGATAIAATLGSVYAGGTVGGTGSVISQIIANTKGLVTGVTARAVSAQAAPQQATAGGTITVTPTLGVEGYWINGPTNGGTVTLNIAAGSQLEQKIIVNISQGATAAIWNFPTSGAGMNFSSSLPAPTITGTAAKRDNMVFILNSGTTLWDFQAITQGFSP